MRSGIRSRRPLTTAAAGLATALTLVGCAPATGSTPTTAPPVPWTECGPGLDCAEYPVPVDHADPDGPTVPLALVRHRATEPDRRLGVLLVNPGGPGGSAVDPIRALDSAGEFGMVSAEVAARYDVIGMDPRGVGGSAGVRCLDDAEREAELGRDLDPELPGGMPVPELERVTRALVDGCTAGVDPELLGRMSTVDVARDMDLVRAGLGEQRVAFLGISYGTLLGATYATLFPDRVSRLVLDAPVHPQTWRSDPLRATVEQAVSGEQQLDAWLATCRAEGPAACPFGAGGPGRAFDELVTRLEATPLPVPAGPAGPGGSLDGADALMAARMAVFDRRLWPVLTAGLVAVEAGDGSTLLTLSQLLTREPDGTPSGLTEANFAVNCLDRDVPADLAAHTANAAEIMAAAPRFGGLSGNLARPCASWPAGAEPRFTAPLTAEGAGPVLVVGGRQDSQTPYPWAAAMTAGLADGHLLTRDGVGHGSYRSSGPCVDAAVDGYLLDGALPADGAVCPQEPAATTSIAGLPTGG